jgi:hypothetical protein
MSQKCFYVKLNFSKHFWSPVVFKKLLTGKIPELSFASAAF